MTITRLTRSILIMIACLTVVLTSGTAQALPQNDGHVGSVVLDYGTAAANPACALSSSKLPICNSL